jgi:hypothetical protein
MREDTSMEGFVRRRIEGIFDNLAAQVIVGLAALTTPIVVGVLFDLGSVTTALIVMLVLQMIILALLLSVRMAVSRQRTTKEPLAQDAISGATYLIDRFGAPRRVSDDDTALYLAEALGYGGEDVPRVSPSALRPPGPEVKALRRWRRPRTKVDEIWAEASRSLKLLGKSVDTVDQYSTVRIKVRNDGDYHIEMVRVDLIIDGAAPLLLADIAPEHKPQFVGYSTCTALFRGSTVSHRLAPEHDTTLEVRLERHLSQKESERIVSMQLGHVVLTCLLHDTKVRVQMDI